MSRPCSRPSSLTSTTWTRTQWGGVNIGEPVAATDPEGDTLTYSLDADQARRPSTLTRRPGQLRTKAALNFETTPNYSVTVTATDTGAATDTIIITITVNNLEEPGHGNAIVPAAPGSLPS